MTGPDIDDVFSLSLACDAIIRAVKLQCLMASEVLFVFLFAKGTLSVM